MDEAIQQFLEIASIDSRDVAEYYLSVSNGDVQAALGMLFEDSGGAGPSSQEQSSAQRNHQEHILVDDEDSRKQQACINVDEHSPQITILEWNIQGLLQEFLSERTRAVVDIINEKKPTVVMLQEVVLESYLYLKHALGPNYVGFSPAESSAACASYFVAIFVDKAIFRSYAAKVIPFPDSHQARQILCVNGRCYDRDITVMTSHLESTRPGEAERKRQLAMLYSVMTQVPQNRTVIFGGDTNLRDFEFNSTIENGKFDLKVVNDIWTMLGSPQDVRYSWDLQKNDNQIQNGKARLRFERMYIRVERKDNESYFKPTDLKFVGTERLPCGKFPSDHWGLLASFAV